MKVLLSIVLPCHNEAGNLPSLLEGYERLWQLHPDKFELILVNNGSTDETHELLTLGLRKYAFLKVCHVEKNIGYGDGITHGLRLGQGEFLSWSHADLQCNPLDFDQVFRMLDRAVDRQSILLKGCRRKRPFLESLFSLLMSCFETLLFGKIIYDISAQPTVLPRSFVLRLLDRAPSDFSFDLFMLVRAKQSKIKTLRFPVLYGRRLHGTSSWNSHRMSRVRMALKLVRASLHLRFEAE